MAVKPNARPCTILEQIVEDAPSGLTFQFTVVEGSAARYRMRIYDAIPGAVREIAFDEEGRQAAAETSFGRSRRRPSWLTEAE